MSTLVLACPSCGKKRICGSAEVGEKVRCACGMIFSVSPVFAHTTPAWVTQLQRWVLSWPVVIAAAVVLAGVGGLAAWLIHPKPPEQKDEPRQIFAAPKPPDEVSKPAPEKKPEPPPPAVVVPPPEPPPPPKPELPPAIKVRPDRLFDAFENADAGMAKFGDKLMELTGPAKLGRDADGRAFLGFSVVSPRNLTPEQLAKLKPRERGWETNGYPPNIRCYLDPAQASAIEALQLDGAITIRGKVRERKDDPNVYMGYVVVVDAEDVGR